MIMPVAQSVSQLFVYAKSAVCIHFNLFTAGRFDEDGSFIGQYFLMVQNPYRDFSD